ncbi:arf-GAP with Rho-GAP domain, ANK repeat and PH domain-containing protein 3 isoform X2 [Hemicordylus capensis]|uniref:arf-GAP with Rho-GAP domain, ANK repeat and PH domain-containing protein 3 isoform X2 n=1 Tax=Hemicordylus capensis TaxID=884348 RepID=UPI002302B75F|nr:arf-GAP with Rho-GAP domain, ANK repeat and PH domain-containing protein 3 isoform X2 [Hemicordylus capensis]
MRPQCCVDSDIADWLAIIHLERYRDAFKQHGYYSVKDAIPLGKEDLEKLGITPTGHRKRILSLVQQTQLLVRDQLGHMAGDARYRFGKCADSLDRPKTDESNDTGQNKEVLAESISGPEAYHDSADHGQPLPPDKEPAPPVAKPIPKPRTVFPHAHRVVKPEQASLPSAQMSVPACISSSDSEQMFIILEGFDPGESTTDAEKFENASEYQAGDKLPEATLSPQGRPRKNNSESALHSSIHLNEMSHETKHGFETSFFFTPPCFISKKQPANPSPTEFVSTTTQVQRGMLLPPAALTKSASQRDRKDIVTDVTYEGRGLLPLPSRSMKVKESPRSQPSTQPSGLAMQNGTVAVENSISLEQLFPDLHHTPQGLANRSATVEEPISPYCEGMFGHCWSVQEQDTASPEWQEYEELPECAPNQGEGVPISRSISTEGKGHTATREVGVISHVAQNETESYSTVDVLRGKSSPFTLSDHLYPDETLDDLTISPYASYTSLSERPPTVLSGWLDKLSPQGNYVFQRRFVRFDGKNLMYFNNEKEPYPKGVIPLSVIEMVRSTKDSKFQVVTSHRVFVFRAESEAQRNEWRSTLQQKVTEQRLLSPRPSLRSSSPLQKSGYLELKGYKSKLFVVLALAEMWLYKSEQFFKMGIAICLIEMPGTTIREAKGRSFELITPFKIFSFGAESEREKREWMEALQNSIAETLYDYEVAEKIWSNKANRFCADCHALNPDWASVNLCVVICKQCAGQHRSLGSSISKVQSLKLDTSIWSNEMVQLFIVLGNEQVNRFWAAHLPPSEVLYPDASTEQRRDFITSKYRYGCYRMPHPQYSSQESILQALCAAVSRSGLLKTMLQFFAPTMEAQAGACSAISEVKTCCNAGQNQQGSYSGNLSVAVLSPEGVYNEITQPVVHCGYMYKAPAMTKLTVTKKSREEFQRVWCSLEKFLLFHETDRSSEPIGKFETADVISLGVNRAVPLTSLGSSDRFRFTLELYLINDRVQQLGADGPDALKSWASAIGKWFTPLSCHCLLSYEFQRVGRLCYKSMLNPNQWLQGFFILQKSHLFICPGEEGAAEDSINLRQLQELSVVPLAEGPEKKEMLILVEMGRTFCLQGASRLDFSTWCRAIQASAGGQGNALRDQQLSRSGIPIIVNSCIAFITQYGLQHEGLYRKNGAKSRIKILMEEFRRDARNVKLRINDNFIEDVTDVLKRFFRELEDPVFTIHLHPQWKEAAEISQKPQRLEQYKELIKSLPHLNRRTLAALISHLYRVQKCANLNQMSTKNLALLFAPSLFQTDGKGEHEVRVMEDLIDNYVHIFNIDDDQVSQMDLENSLITTWRDVQLSQAGDIILEVYLEQKNSDCCVTLKVSPIMTAEELTNQVLEMRSVAASLDIWLTFEVLENGELERPLHPKEKVLEQALQWCKLPKPSSACLLVKKVPIREGSCLFTGAKRESPKCGLLKCREELPKLLGSKFQERYFVIRDRKLLLLKEKRNIKPEREWLLDLAKVYMGIRKKMKPPSQWGFTLVLEKQQLYLACNGQSELWDWTTSILKAQHDSICPVILRRRSSSDLAKQKFGTMPLIPLRGDSTNPIMLSANQTLHRLHTRRTLSMFFPMKMHQDSLEEQQEATESEPVYEEVGNFSGMDFLELDHSLLPPVDRTKKPVTFIEQVLSSPLPPCPVPRSSRTSIAKESSLGKDLCLELDTESLTHRLPGHRVTQSASTEKKTELPQVPSTPNGEQEQPNAVLSLPPEPPASMETQVRDLRKKSFQADLSISDKLMQELSTAIFRKNECQTPVRSGKQNLSPDAENQAQPEE